MREWSHAPVLNNLSYLLSHLVLEYAPIHLFMATDSRSGVARTLRKVSWKGDPAPDFTLQQLGGGLVSLSDFRGKVVLIDIFGYA